MNGSIVQGADDAWCICFSRGKHVYIDKYTGELNAGEPRNRKDIKTEIPFQAIVGYMVVGNEGMLLIVTKGIANGALPGWPVHDVFTVETSQWISIPIVDISTPFEKGINYLSDQPETYTAAAQKESVTESQNYRNTVTAHILSEVILDGTHFWCTTHDLTRHFTGLPCDHETGVSRDIPKITSMWEASEREYVWNEFLAEPFKRIGLMDSIIVLLRGMCQSSVLSTTSNGSEITVTLVTRMRNLNPGSRYQARGLHSMLPGVGNEYECEQIVYHHLKDEDGMGARPFGLKYTKPKGSDKSQPLSDYPFSFTSYVLSRGTVPLLWSQKLQKSTDVSASLSIDKHPFRGVADYWKRVWSRYNTSKFVILNLLRNTIVNGTGSTQEPEPKSCRSPEGESPPSPRMPSFGPLDVPLIDGTYFKTESKSCQNKFTTEDIMSLSSAPCGAVQMQEALERAVIAETENEFWASHLFSSQTSWPTPSRPQMYVLAPYDTLRDGQWACRKRPSRHAPKVKNYHAGDLILVKEAYGGWLCLADGSGWVMERCDIQVGTGWFPVGYTVTPEDSSNPNKYKADIAEEDRELGIEQGYTGEAEVAMLAREDDSDETSSDVCSDSGSEEDFTTAECPKSPSSRPMEESNARLHKWRVGTTVFKGEPLLGRWFEMSLHSLDRLLERERDAAHGPQPPNMPGDDPKHHSTTLKYYNWHGLVKKQGDKKTIEGLWQLTGPYLKDFGVSSGLLYREGEAVKMRHDQTQRGVFRVNCADSLDRTNIVCFNLCLHVLSEQFRVLATAAPLAGGAVPDNLAMSGEEWPLLGLDHDTAVLEVPKSILSTLASLLLDNGDVCATVYCNSSAMHSGMLRTYAGEMMQKQQKNNISIALSRRYQNQFTDKKRTRSIGIFLGRDEMCHAKHHWAKPEVASRTVIVMQPYDVSDPPVVRKEFANYGTLEKLLVNTHHSGAPLTNAPQRPVILAQYSSEQAAKEAALADPNHRFLASSGECLRRQTELKLFFLKNGTTKHKAKTALLQVRNAVSTSGGDIVKNVKNVKGGIAKKFHGFSKAVKRMGGKDEE